MKKLVASVGLVALGASGLNAVYGQGVAATPYKPWNVSASLRGFYDDNINTASDGSPQKVSSFGFQISPGLSLDFQNDQSSVQLAYVYALRWYDKKPFRNANHYDQNHTFNLGADHAFSERYRVAVQNAFVIGQEPDMLRYGYALDEPQRVPGDNIRNYGSINFDAQLTPLFGLEAGYANSFYDYHDDEVVFTPGVPFGNDVIPSRSGALDRLEHSLHLDARFQVRPQTVGILGYQFTFADYTGDDIISRFVVLGVPLPGSVQMSDSRNYRAHYLYVGADHNFQPDLSGSARVGMRYTDYYNSPGGESSISPYLKASMRYNYTVASYAELGVSYDRNATDLTQVTYDPSLPPGEQTGLTLEQQSAVIYGSIRHRLLANLFGGLTGQFQNSTFQGGLYNDSTEQFFLVGLNLQYQFNPYLSASAGYNYDKLESDIGRSFDRNRVYIGLTASY